MRAPRPTVQPSTETNKDRFTKANLLLERIDRAEAAVKDYPHKDQAFEEAVAAPLREASDSALRYLGDYEELQYSMAMAFVIGAEVYIDHFLKAAA